MLRTRIRGDDVQTVQFHVTTALGAASETHTADCANRTDRERAQTGNGVALQIAKRSGRTSRSRFATRFLVVRHSP